MGPNESRLNFSIPKKRLVHKTLKDCSTCLELERRYDHAIAQIRAVVSSRFERFGAKLGQLHRWQQRRDEAVRALYEHRRQHLQSSGKKPAA